MSSRIRNLFLGGLVVAVSAAGVSWLLTSERSPLNEYLLWNPSIRNYWGILNFPSYLAGALVAGNPHDINELIAWTTFFLQWLVIGTLITGVFSLFLKENPR